MGQGSKSHQMLVLQVTHTFIKKIGDREQSSERERCMFRRIWSIFQRLQIRVLPTNDKSMIYKVLLSIYLYLY